MSSVFWLLAGLSVLWSFWIGPRVLERLGVGRTHDDRIETSLLVLFIGTGIVGCMLLSFYD